MFAWIASISFFLTSYVSAVFSVGEIGGIIPRQFQGNSTAVLDVFQVYKPVIFQRQGDDCNQVLLLMEHQFALSYGKPFVGNYEPPKCDFDTVKINFTVTSKGRQFDRLAFMFLGDVEVFRTSTAEPTPYGIVWTYVKDMSQYNALWKQPQKLIFDLGNFVNGTYTGPYNTILTASFSKQNNVKTPDVILPISAKLSANDSSSVFTIPPNHATVSVNIPATASRAIVSISATGQIEEEFWWSNVLNSDVLTFNSTGGPLYGHSPFREVQLYIDGILAGVVWPFPIIFTGGVAPGFWRPIVGIDAFDLRTPEIDISPFLPILTDERSHSFEIKVVGLGTRADGTTTLSNTIGSYWVVTGTIFVYLGDASATKGSIPHFVAPEPEFTITRNLVQDRKTGTNESVSYSVTAKRTLTITSSDFSWTQTLIYSNYGLVNQRGLSQWNKQSTQGRVLVTVPGDATPSVMSFVYPIEVNTTYGVTNNGFTIDAWMNRGLNIASSGGLGVSTYTLVSGPLNLGTTQWGNASYVSNNSGPSFSSGDTSDKFEETSGGRTYTRSVRAINGTVVMDTQGGAQTSKFGGVQVDGNISTGRNSVRGILGRGPGK
ncbi:hypothetical protein AX15_003172 [Amanita polypyramis BW_CC]|nr:hypothetical protein AX15_003172 [Amanita polypyramis BW_CC]